MRSGFLRKFLWSSSRYSSGVPSGIPKMLHRKFIRSSFQNSSSVLAAIYPEFIPSELLREFLQEFFQSSSRNSSRFFFSEFSFSRNFVESLQEFLWRSSIFFSDILRDFLHSTFRFFSRDSLKICSPVNPLEFLQECIWRCFKNFFRVLQGISLELFRDFFLDFHQRFGSSSRNRSGVLPPNPSEFLYDFIQITYRNSFILPQGSPLELHRLVPQIHCPSSGVPSAITREFL